MNILLNSRYHQPDCRHQPMRAIKCLAVTFFTSIRILAVVGLALMLSLPMYAQSDWKPEATWKRSQEDTVASLINQAEKFEEQGNYKPALKIYRQIEAKSINLSNKAKALIAQGRCREQMQKPWEAYLCYKKVIDNYANFVPFANVLQLEYDIAKRFFEGERDRFLFFSFSTDAKAQEIYDHISAKGPYAPFASDAIYRSALISLKEKDYEEAIEKFKQIIARYPLTPIAADARLDLAQTYIKTAADADGDISLIHDAHREITVFLKQNPQHPRLQEAKNVLDLTESLEAQQLLYLGEFYQRKAHKRSPAARRYLNDLIIKYPDTKSAWRAKELLVEITPEYDPLNASPLRDAESPSQLPVDIDQ